MNIVNFIVSGVTVIALIISTYIGWRAASRANRKLKENKTISEVLESRKVDKEAFDQARIIYREGIEEVRQQLVACRSDLAFEKAERQKEQLQIRKLTRRVIKLEAEIRKAGLEVPNGIHDEAFD